jgi:CHRD domain
MKLRYIALACAVCALAVLVALVPLGLAKKGAAKPRPLFAVLKGKNEISPTTGKKGAGDPNAVGSATVLIDRGKLCFGITVTNLDGDPTAAHVHAAKRNKNGPIVVPLTAPSTGDPGASGGCKSIDSTLAANIQRHPSNYYVNVHDATYPAGAARGQLFKNRR